MERKAPRGVQLEDRSDSDRDRNDRVSAISPDPSPARRGPLGWVLYDGTCGVCSKWVPRWAPALARIGLAIAPLQSPWVKPRTGLTDAELAADMRLLLADGTQIVGANAYRFILRRLWWGRPLYVLSILPGLRWLFDTGYRRFADNRHRISHTCGLPGRPGHE